MNLIMCKWTRFILHLFLFLRKRRLIYNLTSPTPNSQEYQKEFHQKYPVFHRRFSPERYKGYYRMLKTQLLKKAQKKTGV